LIKKFFANQVNIQYYVQQAQWEGLGSLEVVASDNNPLDALDQNNDP
jgi:hypothetical protein